MSFKVIVQRISDSETFVESAPMLQDDIAGYLALVANPSMFGNGDFRFVMIQA